ncbi:MAG: nuclease [Chthoniobacter sp.]|nr:nuclease [Chthoniobacter sp.]
MKARCLFGLLALTPLIASAWDAAGHMLVGQIAWEQTEPAAREKVEALVATLENTYNERQPYNFVTAGCWMDDMRSKKAYAWSKWHYVTIPFTPSGSPCPIPAEGPHVVWAIHESLKILRNPSAPAAEAAQALGMLIHFIGDLHQPLHATDRGDRGGNGFLIAGVPFTDLWPGTVANLHAFWDKAFRFDRGEGRIVESWASPALPDRPKKSGEGIIAEQARKIIAAFPVESLPQLNEVLTAEGWTRESHTIGCLAGYPVGPQPTNAEVVTLTPDFAHHAGQIAQLRVALAGYRLARLLNRTFAPDAVATPK